MSIYINVPDHILLEDDFVLVMDKPAGLMVEPDRNGHPNLLHQVRKYLQTVSGKREVYIQHIHRLDRPVSGIVLFAKQRSVLRNLSEQFAERRVKKFYEALTLNSPAHWKGSLEHWHRKEKKKAVLYTEQMLWTEKAVLDYEVKQVADKFLWKIALHTGKFHQIRAQLASTGCPIWGDTLYGSDIPYQQDSIALRACKLIFFHPVTLQEMVIEQNGIEHDVSNKV